MPEFDNISDFDTNSQYSFTQIQETLENGGSGTTTNDEIQSIFEDFNNAVIWHCYCQSVICSKFGWSEFSEDKINQEEKEALN